MLQEAEGLHHQVLALRLSKANHLQNSLCLSLRIIPKIECEKYHGLVVQPDSGDQRQQRLQLFQHQLFWALHQRETDRAPGPQWEDQESQGKRQQAEPEDWSGRDLAHEDATHFRQRERIWPKDKAQARSHQFKVVGAAGWLHYPCCLHLLPRLLLLGWKDGHQKWNS